MGEPSVGAVAVTGTQSCDQIILQNINYVIKYPAPFLSWVFFFFFFF